MRIPLIRDAKLLQTIAWILAMVCAFSLRAASAAQAGNMSIQHGRTFVMSLAGMEFDRVITEPGMVARAIRADPFFEVQFVPLVPERRLRARKVRVYCEEVGVYAPPGGATWTVAKACRLESHAH